VHSAHVPQGVAGWIATGVPTAGPEGRDVADDLVAEHQGFAHPEVADRAAVVIVQVGTADPAERDRHGDLAAARLGRLPVLDAQIARPVDYARLDAHRTPRLRNLRLGSEN